MKFFEMSKRHFKKRVLIIQCTIKETGNTIKEGKSPSAIAFRVLCIFNTQMPTAVLARGPGRYLIIRGIWGRGLLDGYLH